MSLLRIEGVVKRFGGLVALNRVDLRAERGEIVGIIGPNGAGKTTLFNVISGAERPNEGKIVFKEADLVGLKPHECCKRGIGRTFQIVQPFSRLTVLDNVAAGWLFGRKGGTGHNSLAAARRAVAGLLPLGRLEGLEQRPAGTLTLSQRKHLEMVRALATGPELLLLDEVMAGLTPSETEEMARVIREFHESLGLTILIIEHNIRLVLGLSHRIVALNYGEVITEGTPATVVQHPTVIKAYLGERWSRRHCSA